MLFKNMHIIIASDNDYKINDVQNFIYESLPEIKFEILYNISDILKYLSDNRAIGLVIIKINSNYEHSFNVIKTIRNSYPKIGIIIICDEITKDLSLHAMKNSIYNLVKYEDIRDNLISSIVFYLKSINDDKINKDIVKYIKTERITYQIPNSLESVSSLTEHLVRDLSKIGIVSYKRIEDIKTGLQEIIINAIEHGNLEITFSKKSKLLEEGNDTFHIINDYSKVEKFKKRKVTITLTLTKNKAVYKIKDEGAGFNWKEQLKKFNSKDNILLEHGRGIFLAIKYFDKICFNNKGNEAVLEINRFSNKNYY